LLFSPYLRNIDSPLVSPDGWRAPLFLLIFHEKEQALPEAAIKNLVVAYWLS